MLGREFRASFRRRVICVRVICSCEILRVWNVQMMQAHAQFKKMAICSPELTIKASQTTARTSEAVQRANCPRVATREADSLLCSSEAQFRRAEALPESLAVRYRAPYPRLRRPHRAHSKRQQQKKRSSLKLQFALRNQQLQFAVTGSAAGWRSGARAPATASFGTRMS